MHSVMPAFIYSSSSPMVQETPCSFAGVRSDAMFSSINELYAAESRVMLRRALYMTRNPYCELDDEERVKMFRTGTIVLDHLQAEFNRMRPPKPQQLTLCECLHGGGTYRYSLTYNQGSLQLKSLRLHAGSICPLPSSPRVGVMYP